MIFESQLHPVSITETRSTLITAKPVGLFVSYLQLKWLHTHTDSKTGSSFTRSASGLQTVAYEFAALSVRLCLQSSDTIRVQLGCTFHTGRCYQDIKVSTFLCFKLGRTLFLTGNVLIELLNRTKRESKNTFEFILSLLFFYYAS